MLEANFPEILQRAYIYPASGSFRWGWAVASAFFDDITKSKLLLCSDSDIDEQLTKFIEPSVLSRELLLL